MIAPEFEKGVIALACWRGGIRDGVQGMIAVACIVRNRAAKGWAEGSHYLNALSIPTMSAGWEEDGIDLYPDPREPRFQTLLQSLEVILAGVTRDITDGALYYTRDVSNLPPGAERVGVLGTMTFYR